MTAFDSLFENATEAPVLIRSISSAKAKSINQTPIARTKMVYTSYPDSSGACKFALPRVNKWTRLILLTARGRIIMESTVPPLVIPMWLTGFDQLMPEGRAFPYKYFPRPGARLSVTFGDPLPSDDIKRALGVFRLDKPSEPFSWNRERRKCKGWMMGETTEGLNRTLKHNDAQNARDAESSQTRTAVTAIVQKAVESLGRSILDPKFL